MFLTRKPFLEIIFHESDTLYFAFALQYGVDAAGVVFGHPEHIYEL